MKPDIEEPTVPAPVAAAADATKPKKSKIQEHHIPDDDDDDRVHPRDNWFYWVLTVLNWHYLLPMLLRGVFKPLQLSNLPPMAKGDKTAHLSMKFERHWGKLYRKHYGPNAKEKRKGHPLALVLLALFKTFWRPLVISGTFRFFADMLPLATPVLLMFAIQYIASDANPAMVNDPSLYWPGYMYVLGLFLTQLASNVCMNQQFDVASRMGMNVRTVLAAQVYRKSLVLSNTARQRRSTGMIVNLMSIDAEKFQLMMPLFHLVWTSVLQILGCLAMLFYFLRVGPVAALVVLLIVVPLNVAFMFLFQMIRKRVLAKTDDRVRLTNEVLQNIRIVRFFAWESSFIKRIASIRQLEILYFFILAFVKTAIGCVLILAPNFVSVFTFGLFVLAYGQDALQPDVVFPALSYLNQLRLPIMMLPMVFSFIVDMIVSTRRISEFMVEEELDEEEHLALMSATDKEQEELNAEDVIILDRACFEWESVPDGHVPGSPHGESSRRQRRRRHKQRRKRAARRAAAKEGESVKQEQQEQGPESTVVDVELTAVDAPVVPPVDSSKDKYEEGKLLDIDLRIKKGSLVMIVGTVGAGKSSLLSALIGDMKRTSGNAALRGSIAYCAQNAWMVNDTVQGNILFGKEFDEKRYNEIIECCALTQDFKVFTHGDQTEIGEKGVNMSGGQRQRVSLARALYSDADVYLLDDPLSAVDAHVGKFLFDHAVNGYLSGKTRVLVTHQIQNVPFADHVVVMGNGSIVENGTYEELIKIPNGILADMMSELNAEDRTASSDTLDLKGDEGDVVKVAPDQADDVTTAPDQTPESAEQQKKQEKGTLMQSEERTTGSLSPRMLWQFINAAGGPLVVIVLGALFVLSQGSVVVTDWWLSAWTGGQFNSSLNAGSYFGIYVGILAIAFVLIIVREMIFHLSQVLMGKRLHEKMLRKVIRAPTSFFDTTPIGRVINRFSKDVEAMDQQLGMMLGQFLQLLMVTTGIFTLFIVAMYWMSIPIAILSAICLVLHKIFSSSFRELKRLDAITRSPVYSLATETLVGLSTIRAYKKQDNFIRKFEKRLDTNVRTFRNQNDTQRWFFGQLDFIGAFIILVVGVVAMSMRDPASASVMALAMAYSLGITNVLVNLSRSAAEAEAAFNSVERITYYIGNVPNEPAEIIPSNRPPQNWPEKGEIVFENVEARYRPGLPLVIKGISMHIKPNEKIGVVGRTGSGKSTIMLLLFRMFEISNHISEHGEGGGRIMIDNVDISTLGVKDLRSKVAIIPQDPVLFTGTVRSNLDPFNEYSDRYLWDALEKSHLKEAIEKLDKGLDSPVTEGGENFSVGQRQLMCLARALCKQSKILILDEASASLDFATDALIQKTVRDSFQQCTRLTIAHRLNTIIDSDRVLVLSQGEVKEFDSPRNLFLDHPDGIFSSLVDETGAANAAILRKIAFGELSFESGLEELHKNEEVDEGDVDDDDKDSSDNNDNGGSENWVVEVK